jgi:hypothetical protein
MTSVSERRAERLIALAAHKAATRFAFALAPSRVKALLPAGLPGAYLLLDRTGHPIYVGRSDLCLRSRLLRHPLRGTASHFAAAAADGARGAFMLESYWWHRYRQQGELLNLIHPAHTGNADDFCQFCTSVPATRVA